jgi:transposase
MGRCFALWRFRRKSAASRGAFSLWLRFMTAARGRTRLGSAGSAAQGPDGLVEGKSTGRPPLLDDEQRRALVAMVEAGPTPAIHEVVRWRLIDLVQWVFDEYGLLVTKQILSRELRALGYRKLSARPRHHEHDEAVVAAFKKKSRTSSLISRRPPESRSSCGSRTKPASVRRTRSRGAGPNAARDLSP